MSITTCFVFYPSLYGSNELRFLHRTGDLFCRFKNIDQAEMMATVMYSYDELKAQRGKVSESDVLREVLEWKHRWVGLKEEEIKSTIRSLSLLGWMRPEMDLSTEDDD